MNLKTFISFALFIGVGLIIFIGKPNITAWISREVFKQEINLVLDQSQKREMRILEGKLISFSISGSVSGDGTVYLFLENGKGERLLVFKNVRKNELGLNKITARSTFRALVLKLVLSNANLIKTSFIWLL